MAGSAFQQATSFFWSCSYLGDAWLSTIARLTCYFSLLCLYVGSLAWAALNLFCKWFERILCTFSVYVLRGPTVCRFGGAFNPKIPGLCSSTHLVFLTFSALLAHSVSFLFANNFPQWLHEDYQIRESGDSHYLGYACSVYHCRQNHDINSSHTDHVISHKKCLTKFFQMFIT